MACFIPGRLLTICILSFLITSCGGGGGSTEQDLVNRQPTFTYTQPEVSDDGWETATLADTGLDTRKIELATDDINNGRYTGIDSLVIVKDGMLVYENYFNGFNRERRHDLRSATKSITSALIGIAIDQQLIENEEALVLPLISDYSVYDNPDPRKQDIRVRHLLTMTPGLACDDWVNPSASEGHEENMYETGDWVKFILDLPITSTPGQRFAYCTGGVVTLGAILENISGMQTATFAFEYLFGPLGIDNFNWEFTPRGRVDTGGHIHMTPRDMAKIGQLFLQGGQWQGQTLISEAWVQNSTTFKLNTKFDDPYAYLWWIENFNVNSNVATAYYAFGNGGQYIFIFEELDMVVVFTGDNYNSDLMNQPFDILRTYILSAL